MCHFSWMQTDWSYWQPDLVFRKPLYIKQLLPLTSASCFLASLSFLNAFKSSTAFVASVCFLFTSPSTPPASCFIESACKQKKKKCQQEHKNGWPQFTKLKTVVELKLLFFLLHLPLQSVFSTHQFFYSEQLFCAVLPACKYILLFSSSFAIPGERKLFFILFCQRQIDVVRFLTVHKKGPRSLQCPCVIHKFN